MEVTVVASRTPYDQNPKQREAYLFGFKWGFENAITSKLVFAHYERSAIGEASEAGYVHGWKEGQAYLARKQERPNDNALLQGGR